MSEDGPLLLAGKEVVFTGRLAALSRAEAAALVVARDGRCVRAVTGQTAIVVVGQHGLPVKHSGAINGNLRRAQKLQSESGLPLILAEDEFFDRLGLTDEASGVRRLYSPSELCRAVGVTPDQLRGWCREGLVLPVKTVDEVAFFDFRQTAAVRTLVTLARSGVTTARIRRTLQLLRRCLPEIEHPLEQLALLEQDGRMLFRLAEGALADSAGQMHLDFCDDDGASITDNPMVLPSASSAAPSAPPSSPSTLSAGELLALGLEHESAGRPAEAEKAYRQALQLGGPDADVCFNLANVLAQLGKAGPAVERYYQAIEINPRFTDAWNNLGNVHVETGNFEDAVTAYRKALAIDPRYGDCHYNVADALEQLGRTEEAQPHWVLFLGQELDGPWAEHARKRLAKS